ncbi:MAG TPA: hypothetical protein VFX61_02970 [Micromonosporaceae bacterium]|nr:hypothetical protein [Micromonosporaceae bacterium]
MTASRPFSDGDEEEVGPFVRRGKPVASAAEGSGPEDTEPWGWTGGINEPAPWGVSQDSPMDEGSEPTAVTEGRRGERRAGFPAPPDEKAGRHGFGPVEPSRVREAGPGGPPDPAPHRRSFPEPVSTDPPDNSIERQAGSHTRGTRRNSRRRSI